MKMRKRETLGTTCSRKGNKRWERERLGRKENNGRLVIGKGDIQRNGERQYTELRNLDIPPSF